MAQDKVSVCFNQRFACFVIGYWNLVAVLVDIVCLVVIAAVVSDGFQCDVTRESIERINLPWIEPFLVFLNLGSQGFYPLPVLDWHSERPEWNSGLHPHQRKCYPGMVHVYLIDLLIFFVNVIWIKFVIAFVYSIHKKDSEAMTNFCRLSLAKLILQIIYLAYASTTLMLNSFWFIQISDTGIAMIILIIINGYINTLRREKMKENIDIPPPYVETLILAKNPLEQDSLSYGLNKMAVVCDKDNDHKPAQIMHEVYFK
ncbi:hypothetical protein O0L34_g3030 [Tuta absoluta]|nr:hypothetical protein O0L34_g3030 [Tuta absoluta]